MLIPASFTSARLLSIILIKRFMSVFISMKLDLVHAVAYIASFWLSACCHWQCVATGQAALSIKTVDRGCQIFDCKQLTAGCIVVTIQTCWKITESAKHCERQSWNQWHLWLLWQTRSHRNTYCALMGEIKDFLKTPTRHSHFVQAIVRPFATS